MLTWMTDCENGYGESLPVKYAHLVSVYREDRIPLFIVVAEYDDQYDSERGGPLAIGVFDESGHRVVGHSNEMKDIESFVEQATPLLRERFPEFR